MEFGVLGVITVPAVLPADLANDRGLVPVITPGQRVMEKHVQEWLLRFLIAIMSPAQKVRSSCVPFFWTFSSILHSMFSFKVLRPFTKQVSLFFKFNQWLLETGDLGALKALAPRVTALERHLGPAPATTQPQPMVATPAQPRKLEKLRLWIATLTKESALVSSSNFIQLVCYWGIITCTYDLHKLSHVFSCSGCWGHCWNSIFWWIWNTRISQLHWFWGLH